MKNLDELFAFMKFSDETKTLNWLAEFYINYINLMS